PSLTLGLPTDRATSYHPGRSAARASARASAFAKLIVFAPPALVALPRVGADAPGLLAGEDDMQRLRVALDVDAREEPRRAPPARERRVEEEPALAVLDVRDVGLNARADDPERRARDRLARAVDDRALCAASVVRGVRVEGRDRSVDLEVARRVGPRRVGL